MLRRKTSNMFPPRQCAQLREATSSNWPWKPDTGFLCEFPPLDPTLHPQPPTRNLRVSADLHLEVFSTAPWRYVPNRAERPNPYDIFRCLHFLEVGLGLHVRNVATRSKPTVNKE